MKLFLLRSLNRLAWIYPYLGLPYAFYFIYFIVVPAYLNRQQLSLKIYWLFNIVFFYFFLQGYWYLILTRFSSIKFFSHERSHFCDICQCLIPIRDHHCFFVGTCIGYHNRRYFLLMLFHLFCAHCIGYSFVCLYLWEEIGGFNWRSCFRIPFFNIAYLFGWIETKWEAWICFHHYLAYFDFIFIGGLFYQLMKRSLNGQTQYEERKGIQRRKENFSQIFQCSNKFRLIFPLLP